MLETKARELEEGIKRAKKCYFNKPILFGLFASFGLTLLFAAIGANSLEWNKMDQGGFFLCFPALFILFWRLSFHFYFCGKSCKIIKGLKNSAKSEEELHLIGIFCSTESSSGAPFL